MARRKTLLTLMKEYEKSQVVARTAQSIQRTLSLARSHFLSQAHSADVQRLCCCAICAVSTQRSESQDQGSGLTAQRCVVSC
eukprot:3784856-Rhodomonas_salina.1